MDSDRLLHRMQQAIERAHRARRLTLIQLELAQEMVAEAKPASIRARRGCRLPLPKLCGQKLLRDLNHIRAVGGLMLWPQCGQRVFSDARPLKAVLLCLGLLAPAPRDKEPCTLTPLNLFVQSFAIA